MTDDFHRTHDGKLDRNMALLRGRVESAPVSEPEAEDEAWALREAAWERLAASNRACNAAWEAYNVAGKESREARRAYDEARKHYNENFT